MEQRVSDQNFESIARNGYTNVCIDEEEFLDDLSRIKHLKRLLNKFKTSKELKTNLILNHLIVLFNVFETRTLVRLLFFKLNKYQDCLVPFLIFLQRLPDTIEPFSTTTEILDLTIIKPNMIIVDELRRIQRRGQSS